MEKNAKISTTYAIYGDATYRYNFAKIQEYLLKSVCNWFSCSEWTLQENVVEKLAILYTAQLACFSLAHCWRRLAYNRLGHRSLLHIIFPHPQHSGGQVYPKFD